MFKLSNTSTSWKSTLFRPISYQISHTRVSNRGIVRFLKAKKAKLKARWAIEKAERLAMGEIPPVPQKIIEVGIVPDHPRNQFTFLENPEGFFDRDALREDIEKNLGRIEEAFPLGINDLGAFLGYRSGIQKQHFERVLNSILESDELGAQEIEDKLISFMKLAKTLKLYDLFRREHFEFMLGNDMIAGVKDLIQLQKDSPHNIFTPQLAAYIIQYVCTNPQAFFLLYSLKYCNVITEGVRPTKDAAPINQKFFYYIFDPLHMKTNDILPIAHSVMYIFPETFIKTFNINGLFLKEMMSLHIVDRRDEEMENTKYPDIKPEVIDDNVRKYTLLNNFIERNQLNDEIPQDVEQIEKMKMILSIKDDEEQSTSRGDMVKQFGDRQQQSQNYFDRLYRQGKINQDDLNFLKLQQNPIEYQRQIQQYVPPPTDKLVIDPRRFDPGSIDSRLQQLISNPNMTYQQHNNVLSDIIFDKMEFQVERAQAAQQERIKQVDEINREEYEAKIAERNFLIRTVTNEMQFKEDQRERKQGRRINRALQEVGIEEALDDFDIMDLPQMAVCFAKEMDELRRDQEKFMRANPHLRNQNDKENQSEDSIEISSSEVEVDGEFISREQYQRQKLEEGSGDQYIEEGEGIEGQQQQLEQVEQVQPKDQQLVNLLSKKPVSTPQPDSQYVNLQTQAYDLTQQPDTPRRAPRVLQNPNQLYYQQVPINEPSTDQLITEQIMEEPTDVNDPEHESAVQEVLPFEDANGLDDYEGDPEGEYQANPQLEEMFGKYYDQNRSIGRFVAEAFFNTPDLEHGLKSVTLCYLILWRLTHYAENMTLLSEMNIKDLLSLATSNEHYQDLFTTKLSDVLHAYTINKVNIGQLYDSLLNNYTFGGSLLFEPVIVTEHDRTFYEAGKTIQYGKFIAQVEYKAEPEQYLVREQVFESENNRANTEQHPVQIQDIVEAYNQKRVQGGYSYETINLMDSVLSSSSNGMYKLFKKTINQYSHQKSKLVDGLKVENLEGLTKEQMNLLGLSQMTHILYPKSVPLSGSQILAAATSRNIRQNIPVDVLLEFNAEISQKQGAKPYDFFVPQYQKVGQKLKYNFVEPNAIPVHELNKRLMDMDDDAKGRYDIDESLGEQMKLERDKNTFAKMIQEAGNPQFLKRIQEEYGNIEESGQEGEVSEQVITQVEKPIDKETERRLAKKMKRKQQWQQDQKRYAQLQDQFYELIQNDENIDIPRTQEGKLDFDAIIGMYEQKMKKLADDREHNTEGETLDEYGEPIQDSDIQGEEEEEKGEKGEKGKNVDEKYSQEMFSSDDDAYITKEELKQLGVQVPSQEISQEEVKPSKFSKAKESILQKKFDKKPIEEQIPIERNFKKIKDIQKDQTINIKNLNRDGKQSVPKIQQEEKKFKKVFVKPEQLNIKQKQFEEKQKRLQKQKRVQNTIKQQQHKKEIKEAQKQEKKIVQQNWYNKSDQSILKILQKKIQSPVYGQVPNQPQSLHAKALDPFTDLVQPETPQRQQTKHDKRAAHQARKHFKRKDTQPQLTDKQIKQSLPFRADKQKNLGNDKTPKNNFSTMKPKFKFSTVKKHTSSFSQLINSSATLEQACDEIKNIFRRNNNSETLRELMKIPDLMHFKTGTQCTLAIFFYHQGLPLAESPNLKGSFNTSMGDIEVNYNKYLKTTLFDFQLGDSVYIKLLQHLKTNFNRALFKKVLAHIVRYCNTISFQLATEVASFVTDVNVPMTHMEFVNLVTLNDLRVSLSTLMVLLVPLANYAETSKDVFTIYKTNMLKLAWPLSLYPLQNYIIKLNRAGELQYISQMVEDIRKLITSRKFKLTDKNISSEENKRLQTEFKEEIKKEQLKYVIETASVLGFTGCFQKAQQLFDQYKSQRPQLSKQQIKIGFYCYTMNSTKFQQLFDLVNKNKEFISVDMYTRILQPIKKTSRNKIFLDKILQTFIYSGVIQKQLTSVEINQTIEAFIRSKNTNSYPRFLEHMLKYQLKLDENSYKLFYNVIKESHTTADSKRMIVNLLDIIFNKDREEERKNYVLTREREEEKKRKLDEMKENQLRRIRSNMQELDRMTKETTTKSEETEVQVKVEKSATKQSKQKSPQTKQQIPTPQTPVSVTPVVSDASLEQQLKKGGKSQKGQKKSKKTIKDQQKTSKILQKADRKSKSKLYQEDAPENKKKDIIPQELRLAVTPKQMRRGGRRKFFFLVMTQQQIKDDEAAREAMKKKRQ